MSIFPSWVNQIVWSRHSIATSYVGRLDSGGAAPGIDLVARLADASGTTVEDLLHSDSKPDQAAVLKKRVKSLFDDLMKNADRDTLLWLVPVLARLGESPARKR